MIKGLCKCANGFAPNSVLQALWAIMSDTTNHHFIPQFYLRNFSEGCDRRKAKVFTFDQSTLKSFATLVRNVGSRRNFFRIEAEGFDPNHVEDGMAAIEGEIAPLLEEVIATESFPSDSHFSMVMLLMGNVAVRNPRFRSMIEDLHLKMAGEMMRAALQDKDKYQESIRQVREGGAPIRDDVSYDDMKPFIERGEYKIAIDQTYLVGLELDAVPTVVEQLARRSWAFASAPAGSTFTTCDDPVVLAWDDGKDRGPYSPGFGVAGTIVMFPISPELALIGLFLKQPLNRAFRRDQVADMNTSMAKNATKQLYARDGELELHTRSESYTRGKDLPAALGRQRAKAKVT
ncbi:YbcA protein [Neorhizobium galegae bv. orientalis]|nr:YbcA protein [Neorhizobium galegae bv. orientalis]